MVLPESGPKTVPVTSAAWRSAGSAAVRGAPLWPAPATIAATAA